jgi:hypothetical protein
MQAFVNNINTFPIITIVKLFHSINIITTYKKAIIIIFLILEIMLLL